MGVAVITGAAGGIGVAVVKAFENANYDCVLLDRQKIDEPGLVSIALDLSNPVDVQSAFAKISGRFNEIDALVNLAGVNLRSSVRNMQVTDWDELMNINVGHMFLTAKCAMSMMRRGSSITNMASISGHVASADYPAYVTSKAAVESLTIALSVELKGAGIRVNAVAPGWVNAGFTHAALDTSDDPDAIFAAAKEAHLLGRMAEPDEIAEAILWLAGPTATSVNGQTLFVDGGLMRKH